MNLSKIENLKGLKNKSVTCYVLGLGALLKICTEKLLHNVNYDVMGFISADEDAIYWAKKQGLRTLQLVDKVRYDLSENEIISFVKQHEFDYFFSIVNAMKLPNSLISLPKKFAINFHDSKLPEYAGVDATSWAIMKRESIHAVTWHKMSNDIDEGGIILQQCFPVEKDETAFTLNGKCFEAGIHSFEVLLDKINNGDLEITPQNLSKRSYYSRYRPFSDPNLNWNYGIIDWNNSAEDIDAIVRSLNFGSYRNTMLTSKIKLMQQYVIVESIQIIPFSSSKPAGTIIDVDSEYITVSTLTTNVRIWSLRYLDGRPYPFDNANISVFHPGSRLDYELPDKEEIYQLEKQCIWNERFWSEEILKTQRKEVSSANYSPSSEFDTYIIKIDGINNSFLFSLNNQALMITVFILVISAVENRNNIPIWTSLSQFQEKFSKYSSIFSLYLPSCYKIKYCSSINELMHNFNLILEETVHKGGFHLDLLYRFKELRSSNGWLNYNDFGLCFLSDSEINYDYSFGLQLQVDASFSSLCLIFDKSRYSYEKASIYVNSFKSALNRFKEWSEAGLSALEVLYYLRQISAAEKFVYSEFKLNKNHKDSYVDLLDDLWCKVLGISETNFDQNFFHIGDSMAALKFTQGFNLITQRNISLSYIYKNPFFSDWIELLKTYNLSS